MTQSFVYESGEGMAVKAHDLEEDSHADEQPASIVRHDAAVARAFRLLGVEPENWVPTRPGTDHDVVVVGGGQSGVAIAFALRRAGITRTTVIDAADEGAEGVWLTTARMNKLRSPKTLPGPELGMFDLGFQSWYEARHGEKAFAAMDAIPRLDWAAYLRWFRKAAGIPVRYGARLDRIEPDGRGLRLRLSVDGQAVEEVCRKLVLATGFAGSGGMNFPAFVKRVVPKHLRAHAEEEIDFYKLRGRRIAIFGAASSAFDAAAVALEHGAASAHLFCRHDDLERCFPMRMLFYPGSVEHFRELPDADRWRIMSTLCRRAQGPAPDTVKRAARFKAFHLHLGARNPVLSVHNDQIRLELVAGNTRLELEFDFVIAGTGYSMDLSQRPELAGIVEHIASWSDRYSPPPGEENAELSLYPYLSPGFAFTEKQPGAASFLKNIHFFSAGALLSNGRNPGEISGLRHGAPQLVSAIGSDLFRDDAAAHVVRATGDCAPILSIDEYRARVWRDGQNSEMPVNLGACLAASERNT